MKISAPNGWRISNFALILNWKKVQLDKRLQKVARRVCSENTLCERTRDPSVVPAPRGFLHCGFGRCWKKNRAPWKFQLQTADEFLILRLFWTEKKYSWTNACKKWQGVYVQRIHFADALETLLWCLRRVAFCTVALEGVEKKIGRRENFNCDLVNV